MNAFWVTWHYSRRSRNLAKEFKVPILEYVNETNIFIRHCFSTIWTCCVVVKYRPSTIFLQYSFLLLWVIVIYKILTHKKVQVICDCHTKALRRKLKNPFDTFYWRLKKLSFVFTDICLISNSGLESDIRSLTTKYFILPDKIPVLNFQKNMIIDGLYCVFVSSYAVDEPLQEVIQAAEKLERKIKMICTGRIPKSFKYLRTQPYTNIIFTDYLKDGDYVDLIANAQCIIALTTEEDCLQCAGYEALSVQTTLILSNKSALKNYYEDSAIYVENKADDIIKAVKYSLKNKSRMLSKMEIIKKKRTVEHKEIMIEIKNILNNTVNN